MLDLCAALPGAAEDYPFGEGVAVFKVGGCMFALVPLEGSPGSVNLKCDPDLALELRARYPSVHPGYPQKKPALEHRRTRRFHRRQRASADDRPPLRAGHR
ncbi:MmcQ/YjbR family DNA-binding protein [Actinopolymorpha pittospori]|uniref:MmcQ/YjbR family DNA-binding protein n=1 Tax=Actinopolymorpha pittospori TaxID=648752 RepID=UPI003CD09A67